MLNPDAEGRRLSSKTTLDLAVGDMISYRTCGGGGYGDPAARDPRLVQRDVRDRKVSVERARDLYRVEIDPSTWAVDEPATERLRTTDGDAR